MSILNPLTSVAGAFALSTTMATAQEQETPTIPNFMDSQAIACDQDVYIDPLNITVAQRDLYYRIAVIGCEMMNRDNDHPHNTDEHVRILQRQINLFYQAEGIERNIAIDGVLGSNTVEGFFDYAMGLDVYKIFHPNFRTELLPNELYMANFLLEIEQYAKPGSLKGIEDWAVARKQEDLTTKQERLRDFWENLPDGFFKIPTEPNLPRCNEVGFEGKCEIDIHFNHQWMAPAPQSATYNI